MTPKAIDLGKRIVMTSDVLHNIESNHYDWLPQDEFDYFLSTRVSRTFKKIIYLI